VISRPDEFCFRPMCILPADPACDTLGADCAHLWNHSQQHTSPSRSSVLLSGDLTKSASPWLSAKLFSEMSPPYSSAHVSHLGSFQPAWRSCSQRLGPCTWLLITYFTSLKIQARMSPLRRIWNLVIGIEIWRFGLASVSPNFIEILGTLFSLGPTGRASLLLFRIAVPILVPKLYQNSLGWAVRSSNSCDSGW